MWKVADQTKWRSMVEIMLGVSLQRHHAVLRLLSSSSFLSKVNCSGADVQVISCHCYLVIVHAIVEQLTVFYISGLVLYCLLSSSIFESYVAISQCHHEPERYANYA